MSMTVIEHIEVTAATQASLVFDSIPAIYTDLVLTLSARTVNAGIGDVVSIAFNGSTSNFTTRYLYGDGANDTSSTATNTGFWINGNTSANYIFSNGTLYIPNYTSSNAKSYSTDSVSENNVTNAYQIIIAGLWNPAVQAAINEITLTASGNFMQYTSATLCGIKSGSDGTTTVS